MEYVENDNYTIDDRSNRYLNAAIDWDSIPKQFRNDFGLAIRGTYNNPELPNKDNCGSVRYTFPKNDEIIFALNNCHKLSCSICGMSTSYRQGKRISIRLLMVNNCGWDSIRFFSLNFFNKETLEYGNENYFPMKNENFHDYLKRITKFTSKLLKINGMVGFYLIFHATRLKQIDDDLEVQIWSPHFHVIGIGMMTNSSIFYNAYGFIYKMQKSIKFNDKNAIKNQLVGRIGYRLNHSAFSYNKSGRQSNSYAGYGFLANNMIKVLESKKIIDKVLDKNGVPVVAKDLTNFISSDKPERIKRKMYDINKRMVIDIKNTGYPRVKDDHDFKKLNRLIFDKKLKIDESWKDSELEIVTSPYTNEPIYLVDVENIFKVQVKGYPSHIVSTYQLHKNKKPRKYLLDSVRNRAKSVNERFMIKKAVKLLFLQ